MLRTPFTINFSHLVEVFEGKKEKSLKMGGTRQQVELKGNTTADSPELLKWRVRAKIIAYLDMLINAAFIGFCAAFLTTVSVYFVMIEDQCLGAGLAADEVYVKAGLGGLWVILLSGILSRGISLWTAIMLLQAAVMAKDKADAEKLTWFWRALTVGGLLICPVVSAVSGVALYYISMNPGFLIFVVSSLSLLVYDFFWRILSYWFVHRFLSEFDNVAVNKVSIEA